MRRQRSVCVILRSREGGGCLVGSISGRTQNWNTERSWSWAFLHEMLNKVKNDGYANTIHTSPLHSLSIWGSVKWSITAGGREKASICNIADTGGSTVISGANMLSCRTAPWPIRWPLLPKCVCLMRHKPSAGGDAGQQHSWRCFCQYSPHYSITPPEAHSKHVCCISRWLIQTLMV